jgi:glutaredoxin
MSIPAILVALVVAAPPAKVVVYGAAWCGPCKEVRGYLEENRVPFEYRDVDLAANRDAWVFAAKGNGGIPLTIVGKERVRGSNLVKLARILRSKGFSVAGDPVGPKLYGGHPLNWWKDELASLRAAIERVRGETTQAGVEVLHKQDELSLLEGALAQLEADAAEAKVPLDER